MATTKQAQTFALGIASLGAKSAIPMVRKCESLELLTAAREAEVTEDNRKGVLEAIDARLRRLESGEPEPEPKVTKPKPKPLSKPSTGKRLGSDSFAKVLGEYIAKRKPNTDGVVVVTATQLAKLGFPVSAQKYSAYWRSTTNTGGKICVQLKVAVAFSAKAGEEPTVSFTPRVKAKAA